MSRWLSFNTWLLPAGHFSLLAVWPQALLTETRRELNYLFVGEEYQMFGLQKRRNFNNIRRTVGLTGRCRNKTSAAATTAELPPPQWWSSLAPTCSELSSSSSRRRLLAAGPANIANGTARSEHFIISCFLLWRSFEDEMMRFITLLAHGNKQTWTARWSERTLHDKIIVDCWGNKRSRWQIKRNQTEISLSSVW